MRNTEQLDDEKVTQAASRFFEEQELHLGD